MRLPDPALMGLQLRLALARKGLIACAAGFMCVAGTAGLLWFMPHMRMQNTVQAQALAQARKQLRAPDIALQPALVSLAEQRLVQYYDVLGEKRYAEQQVKALFAIAHKTGLNLNQAEYKSGLDKNSRTSTYQIVVPVKGSYRAIRQFCEQTLLAIPFASLDEMSFKRETIGSNELEAKLRFTLYLADAPRLSQESGAQQQ